ncbi:MAG TPA: SDR family oxidoreductase [Mycobacterium sp.]|jgi:NAD(P)-dependent dehydrogenase (short-subunit alcohol dehydrogenase family)|nr:SDR family oxidoreductase [Mycobacterium sp.]
MSKTILVVGGTSGIGAALARDIVARGDRVILTGRDEARAKEVAAAIGDRAQGIALDLSEPETIASALASVGRLNGLVLGAIERDQNTVRDYDIARAKRLTILKLVGYTETVHALLDRLEVSVDTGIVLFGGKAKDIPYPGSTTVSTINGGIIGLVNTLALELAPIRVNALHPGVIGDSEFWAEKTAFTKKFASRTPGGELATVADVVEATQFLLSSRGTSGHDLDVDRGWTLT